VSAPANRWVIAAATICLIVGVALSHLIEPGVKVEAVTLAGDTPAIHLGPTAPGPHQVALLVHGASGSKESLFRYGEALTAAGFDSFVIDLPGHGASPLPFSFREVGVTPAKVGRALGSVDVYLGHSMGAGAGGVSVRDTGFAPRLFIAVGANPKLGEHGPPLLLLAGQFDEFVRPPALKARTDARLVLSPWSDHVLEL
jgi:alpha-beta hydrolase superfamily lysophospholipase